MPFMMLIQYIWSDLRKHDYMDFVENIQVSHQDVDLFLIKMLTCLDIFWSEKRHHSQLGTIEPFLVVSIVVFVIITMISREVKYPKIQRSKKFAPVFGPTPKPGPPNPKKDFNGGEKGEKPQLEKKGSVDTIKSDPHQHSSNEKDCHLLPPEVSHTYDK